MGYFYKNKKESHIIGFSSDFVLHSKKALRVKKKKMLTLIYIKLL